MSQNELPFVAFVVAQKKIVVVPSEGKGRAASLDRLQI